MSNIVPQPQITFENNKIYVDSPVDVKYTLDGLDPVFYGVIYTSPISISHTTTIKAISVNSLGEISNLVAGTFTPESDVSDGSSGSTWNPSYDDAVTLEELSAMSYVTSYALESASYATTTYVADYVAEHGGGEILDLSSYVTKDELSSCGYITESDVAQMGYITIDDVPETDLTDYVTYDFLSSQSYLTSIPSEYITQQELSSNSYLTQHQDLSGYLLSPTVSGYTGQMRLYNDGFLEVTNTGNLRAKTFTYNSLNAWNAYTLINRDSLRNYVNGRLSQIESSYVTTTDLNNYLPYLGTLQTHYTNSEHFLPKANNTYYLGNTNFRWQLTYTYNLYTNTAYLQGTSYSSSIVPKENNTYTLGDSSHLYANAYIARIGTSNNGMWIDFEGTHKYIFASTNFRPSTNNYNNLGHTDYRFNTTYSYIYKLGYNTSISSDSDYGIQTTINGHKNFQWNLYQFSMIENNYRDVCSLGTSSTPWAYTYTNNLILNGVNATEVFTSYSYINTVLGDIETLLSNI